MQHIPGHQGTIPVHHQHHYTHVQDLPTDPVAQPKQKPRYNPLFQGFGGQPMASLQSPTNAFDPKVVPPLQQPGFATFSDNQSHFTSPSHAESNFREPAFHPHHVRHNEQNPLMMNYGNHGEGGKMMQGFGPQGSGGFQAPQAHNFSQNSNIDPSLSHRSFQNPHVGNQKKNPLQKVPQFERRIEAGNRKK